MAVLGANLRVAPFCHFNFKVRFSYFFFCCFFATTLFAYESQYPGFIRDGLLPVGARQQCYDAMIRREWLALTSRPRRAARASERATRAAAAGALHPRRSKSAACRSYCSWYERYCASAMPQAFRAGPNIVAFNSGSR